MCLQWKHPFVVLVLHVSFDLYISLMQRMRPWTINNVLRFTNWETRDSGKIEADSEIMTFRWTVTSVLIYSLQKMKSCDIWLTVFHPSSKLSVWSERETMRKSLRERERTTERAITHIHFFNNLPGEPANRMLKYVRDSINIFAHAPTLSFPGPCVSLLFYLV